MANDSGGGDRFFTLAGLAILGVVLVMIAIAAMQLQQRPRMTAGSAAEVKAPAGVETSSFDEGEPGLPRLPRPEDPIAPSTPSRGGLVQTPPVSTTPAVKPGASPPPAREGTGLPAATRDRDSIVAVVAQARSSTASCYEQAVATSPGLAGRILVAWTITAVGTVDQARVEFTDIDNADLTNCVLRQVSRLRFAPGSEATEVRFPFVFSASP